MDIQTLIQIAVWSMAVIMIVAPIVYLKWIGFHYDTEKTGIISDDDNVDVTLGYKGL